MPFEPLRFVHASNLCLDHQLADTGPLPAEHHTLVQDATFEAFDRVVGLCLDRRVDFLVLAGNSFDHRDRSVRAHADLGAEFERLVENGIQVFVIPGALDPAHAWQSVRLPDGVTLLTDHHDEPVAVLRGDRTIATICPIRLRGETRAELERDPRDASRRPFAVGVCTELELPATTLESSAGMPSGDVDDGRQLAQSLLPKHLTACGVDYLALGGQAARRTIGLKSGVAHHPGHAQGLSPAHRGPQGCTLVDVNSSRQIDCKFIPTAPVRWERLVVKVDAETTHTHLLERMRAALRQSRPESNEQLWLCHWTLQGSGGLFESLYDAQTQRQLVVSLGSTSGNDGGPTMTHSLCLVPDAAALSPACRFAQDYFDLLAQPGTFAPSSLEDRLTAAAILEAGGSDRVHSLIAELDPDVISGHAHRLGMTLFGVDPVEGPPHEDHRHSY